MLKKEEQIAYLEYSLLITKIHHSLINFDSSIFWVSKSSSKDNIIHETIWLTWNIKKSDFKQNNAEIFWTLFYSSIIFLDYSSKKFLDQPPPPWSIIWRKLW